MRVIDTDQDNSRIGGSVHENFIVDFWYGNFLSCSANVEENIAKHV